MQRAHTDERGAVAVLVGVLLPMLLGMSALGFATLTMAGGERELQRAADAGALSAASRLELASLDGVAPTISNLLPADVDVQSVGCGVAGDNLDAAALTSGFAETVTCSAGPATFRANLATALDQGLGLVPTEALDALNQVVNVPALLPAIATPYVEVTTGSDLDPPLRGLLSPAAPGDMEVSAVARRRFKNAVLAPVVDVDDTVICQGDVLSALGVTIGTFTEKLGTVINDLTLLNNVKSCRFDANPALGIPKEPALGALETIAGALPSELAPAAGAIRELRMDFGDLYDPPPDGSDAPTQWDIIDAAASNNEDVLVILADQSTASSLLSGLVGATRVPVLDAVIVPATTLQDGTVDVSDELSDVAAAKGIFRATLVRR